jgi:hypothetical protein
LIWAIGIERPEYRDRQPVSVVVALGDVFGSEFGSGIRRRRFHRVGLVDALLGICHVVSHTGADESEARVRRSARFEYAFGPDDVRLEV